MKQKIEAENAPTVLGAYSQAVRVGNVVYLAGQIPLDPVGNVIMSKDFTQQTEQVFANIFAVCEACGSDLNGIVKLTVYLTDLLNFSMFNLVMTKLFTEPFPARTTIQVAAL